VKEGERDADASPKFGFGCFSWVFRSKPTYKFQKRRASSGNEMENLKLGEYYLVKVLGKGSFGTVLAASKVPSCIPDQLVAIKVLDKEAMYMRRQLDHTLTEKSILMNYGVHPFVLQLEESFQTPTKACLATEFCSGGDVFYHLERLGRFDEDVTRFFTAEAMDALIFLHSHGVAYRDLKCENMLLDGEGHVRLADFGLARMKVTELSRAFTICGSTSYMAPEMILCHSSQRWRSKATEYGFMVDYWSLGTMIFDMLCGEPPFFHPSKQTMFNRVVSSERVSFPHNVEISGAARHIICGLLCRDPRNRISFSGNGGSKMLYSHPFFEGIDWQVLREKRYIPPNLATKQPQESSRTLQNEVNDSHFTNFDWRFTQLDIKKAIGQKPGNAPSGDMRRALKASFTHWNVKLSNEVESNNRTAQIFEYQPPVRI